MGDINVEYQRKENLQKKTEILRERTVEVPLRPPKRGPMGEYWPSLI
jgi:hypothetical protein